MIDNDRIEKRQKTDTGVARVDMTDDTTNYRRAYVTYDGTDGQKALLFSPYGLCSNPANSSMAIYINLSGEADNKAVLVDDPLNRKKNLEKGEVAIVNYLTGSNVYLKEDNSIDIESASGAKISLLADGTIEINGNDDFAVAFTDLQTAFDQLKTEVNAIVSAYNSATYTISGVGTTGTTSVPATAATADMSGAKVDTVKLP